MLMAHFMQTLGDLVGNGNCCVGGAIPLVEAERTARFSRNLERMVVAIFTFYHGQSNFLCCAMGNGYLYYWNHKLHNTALLLVPPLYVGDCIDLNFGNGGFVGCWLSCWEQ